MVNVGKYTIHGWYGIQLHNDKIIKIQIQHSEISLFARPIGFARFRNKKVVAYSNSTDRYQHLRAPSVSSTVTKGFLACGIKSNTFQRCWRWQVGTLFHQKKILFSYCFWCENGCEFGACLWILKSILIPNCCLRQISLIKMQDSIMIYHVLSCNLTSTRILPIKRIRQSWSMETIAFYLCETWEVRRFNVAIGLKKKTKSPVN